jgi:hypothetical protein
MTLTWSFQNNSIKSPHATLSLRDGTVLSLSKLNNSMIMTLSTADGLVIDFLPDRKVCQRITCFESINKAISEVEISRMIYPNVKTK